MGYYGAFGIWMAPLGCGRGLENKVKIGRLRFTHSPGILKSMFV